MEINQKIVIVTHELVYGVSQSLRDYLIKRKALQLLFIAFPFIASPKAYFSIYKKGKKIKEKITYRNKRLGLFDIVLDFLWAFWLVYSQNEKYDLFIGVNNLNCFAGLLLKKLGKVRKVVFYTMDFVPIRFNNKVLNYIYHQIEIICVKQCDEVWNVSPRMAEGREKFLGLSKDTYPQKVVPVGIWNDKIKKRTFAEIKKTQLLFIGHLLEKQGIQIVLEALPKVIKKIKNLHFLIVGGGEYENFLKNKVKELKLEKYVEFTGWILDRNKLDQMFSESAIGMAVYKPEKKRLRNFTYYADPFKIKDYLGAGLAIILTDISFNAKEIAKEKCGILVEYDQNEIANAIVELLKDHKTLQQYRLNALRYAKKYDWIKIYDKIFLKK